MGNAACQSADGFHLLRLEKALFHHFKALFRLGSLGRVPDDLRQANHFAIVVFQRAQ